MGPLPQINQASLGLGAGALPARGGVVGGGAPISLATVALLFSWGRPEKAEGLMRKGKERKALQAGVSSPRHLQGAYLPAQDYCLVLMLQNRKGTASKSRAGETGLRLLHLPLYSYPAG